MNVPLNEASNTITGFLKIKEARGKDLDFEIWRFFNKISGDQFSMRELLIFAIKTAKTEAELVYLTQQMVGKALMQYKISGIEE